MFQRAVMKVLLDSNIYDKLSVDPEACARIEKLIHSGDLQILVSPTVYDELSRSPFNGIPSFFPVNYVGESVLVAGGRVGDRCGTGYVLKKHLGKSRKIRDAFIADVAATDAEYLVSEDNPLKNRLNAIQSRCQGIDFFAFINLISQTRM
jgi:hypothetical protein